MAQHHDDQKGDAPLVTSTFSLLQNEEASVALRENLARVSDQVSYLKAEVGPVPCVTPHSELAENITKDGAWHFCDDLLGDVDWLCEVIRSSGQAIGTDSDQIAASIFVQGYSYRLLTLTIASALIGGVIPQVDPATTAVGFSRGRVAKIAYLTPTLFKITQDRDAIREAMSDPEIADHVLRLIIESVVDDHLRRLVTKVREGVSVGERLLWGNIAASASTAFRTMEGGLGEWVIPLGERFFTLAPPTLTGLGSFLTIEIEGRRGWFWERTNCCLFDRVAGRVRCADCSLTPREERRAAYEASLRGD